MEKCKEVGLIDKSCGLSVTPEVDLTDAECSHYHSTNCIIHNGELESLGKGNATQYEVNEKFDDDILDIRNDIGTLKEYNATHNVLTYEKYTIVNTTLKEVMLNGVDVARGHDLEPIKVEIKNVNKLPEVVDTRIDIKLNGYNDSDRNYIIHLVMLNKLRSFVLRAPLYVPADFRITNLIRLEPSSPSAIDIDMDLEIKLFYNTH